MNPTRTLTERAAASSWVADEPGLADAVAKWEHDHGARRLALHEHVAAAVKPAAIPPARLGRHAVAVGLSRTVRTVTRLPGAVAQVLAGGEPRRIALDAAVEGFVDQLALGGAASAEVARIIEGSGTLFPALLRDELAGRTIRAPALQPVTARGIVRRSVGPVAEVAPSPYLADPVSQLHRGRLQDDRDVDLRIRRPGVASDLAADVRLMAGLAAAAQRMAPDAGGMGMGPMGFVELIARMGIEGIDLRLEGLDLLELGLIAEETAVPRLRVARPIPGYVSERVLGTGRVDGRPLVSALGDLEDPAGVIAAVTSLTLESALLTGAFWADPCAEHLVLGPDGDVVIVRAGVVGHLTPTLRRAGIMFLTSLFTNNPAGQVEAMRMAGAVPPGLDVDALIAELSGSDALQVNAIMGGGEAGLLGAVNEAVRLMLKHQLAPPVEVVLLLRTVFAVGRFSDQLQPGGGGFLTALMGLVPKLLPLLASLDNES